MESRMQKLTRQDMEELYREVRRQVDEKEQALVGRDYPGYVGGLVNPYAEDVPYGWIQHKGSDLCMDIHCECGELHHVDADFCYEVRVPCGRVYSVGAHVPLFLVPGPSEDGDVCQDAS